MTLLSRTLTANSGMMPTAERSLSGIALAVDQKLVVVEAILLVPQPGAAEGVHGVGDVDEVLEELRGDVFVGGVFASPVPARWRAWCAIERHPRGAVGLLEMTAAGQGLGAVEDADVVQAEEARRQRRACPRRPCDSPTR